MICESMNCATNSSLLPAALPSISNNHLCILLTPFRTEFCWVWSFRHRISTFIAKYVHWNIPIFDKLDENPPSETAGRRWCWWRTSLRGISTCHVTLLTVVPGTLSRPAACQTPPVVVAPRCSSPAPTCRPTSQSTSQTAESLFCSNFFPLHPYLLPIRIISRSSRRVWSVSRITSFID